MGFVLVRDVDESLPVVIGDIPTGYVVHHRPAMAGQVAHHQCICVDPDISIYPIGSRPGRSQPVPVAKNASRSLVRS